MKENRQHFAITSGGSPFRLGPRALAHCLAGAPRRALTEGDRPPRAVVGYSGMRRTPETIATRDALLRQLSVCSSAPSLRHLARGIQDAAPPLPSSTAIARSPTSTQLICPMSPSPGTPHGRLARLAAAAPRDTVIVQPGPRGADCRTLPLRNLISRSILRHHPDPLPRARWDTRPRADFRGSSDSTAPLPGATMGLRLQYSSAGRALQRSLRRSAWPALLRGADYGDSRGQVRPALSGTTPRNPLPGPRRLPSCSLVGDAMLQSLRRATRYRRSRRGRTGVEDRERWVIRPFSQRFMGGIGDHIPCRASLFPPRSHRLRTGRTRVHINSRGPFDK